MILDLIKLARPTQWIKSGFVLIGPAYALADGSITTQDLPMALWVCLAFALISSACYAINDVRDVENDKHHPRKALRPIASGRISSATALTFALILTIFAAGCLFPLSSTQRTLAGLCLAIYAMNTLAYSIALKHRVIADVVSLAMGFVLRVLAGCAAVGATPSTFLLNVTFFLAMFLAFGKRLGERRTLGQDASLARTVQAGYSDDILRLAVLATGVVTLVTYASYVQSRDAHYHLGFNLLWLTMLPATYGLLRCIVLLERGTYDDPTELATKDRPFQAAAFIFVLLTATLMYLRHIQTIGTLTDLA